MDPSDPLHDASNGYEAVASEYVGRRDRSAIGVETVRTWARSLPRGASILDLGCGHGVPIASALIKDGFDAYGIDASRTLAEAFRKRLPGAKVACEPVEHSDFFGRSFDAILAIGLMFLLPPDVQRDLISRCAAALDQGGRFLFSSPRESCMWMDALTGRRSVSLGAGAYAMELERAGLILLAEYRDEGENHYYDAALK